jgi:hypothetical protein
MRSASQPPFKLRQERADLAPMPIQKLEAYPTGQGDYWLGGRRTYPIRERIQNAGGQWDNIARRWTVSKEQALVLGAVIYVRVLRAPACCERHMEPANELLRPPDRGIPAVASQREVSEGRMIVRFCPHCDSHIQEPVAIRDVLDMLDVPELP